MSPVDKPEVPRCPYCVSEGQFNGMRVLENGRQICEKCGHIVFPEDRAFWCPCQKCLEARFWPKQEKCFRVSDVEHWIRESERGSRESLNRVLDNSHR